MVHSLRHSLLSQNGEAFILKYAEKYPYMVDIKSFLIRFASDSGSVASC